MTMLMLMMFTTSPSVTTAVVIVTVTTATSRSHGLSLFRQTVTKTLHIAFANILSSRILILKFLYNINYAIYYHGILTLTTSKHCSISQMQVMHQNSYTTRTLIGTTNCC